MLGEYLIENLLIGNFNSIHNVGGSRGIVSMSDGPFIFYKLPTAEGKKQKCIEVFTEDSYKISNDQSKQKFGKTYVIETQIITMYLTEQEIEKGIVSKKRLLDIYNDIREKKVLEENNHVLTK